MIELSDVIRELRAELTRTMAEGTDEHLRFGLGTVDLELSVAVERDAGVDGKVKFLVVELGGTDHTTRTRTQTVRLRLEPHVLADGVRRDATISGHALDRED